MESSSSVVECRNRDRESPGSNPLQLLPFLNLDIFVHFTAPQSTQLYKLVAGFRHVDIVSEYSRCAIAVLLECFQLREAELVSK